MAVGDVNSNEKGSGARYNEGKPDFSLIPFCTMEDEARVWAYGKKKYAAWNWCKGMDWDVPFACMMRHMAKWQMGEENDSESGLPHLAHALCNLRMLTLFAKTYKEGDTRPTKWLEDFFDKAPVQTDIHSSLQNNNLPTTAGVRDNGMMTTKPQSPPPQILRGVSEGISPTHSPDYIRGEVDSRSIIQRALDSDHPTAVTNNPFQIGPETYGWTASATNKTK